MLFDLFKSLIFGNGIFYSLILISIFLAFAFSLSIAIYKSFQIFKNNYYSYLFEQDLWNQSLEKNIDNAKQWEDRSTLVKMFSDGFKTFMIHQRKNSNYNSGSNIHLTKNTMKVILLKDQEYFTQGLNVLAFSSIFIPYASLSLAVYEMLIVFTSFEIGVLSLSMFNKAMFLAFSGFVLTGFITVFYMIIQNRLDVENTKSLLFIEEFGNFLHKNFYYGENE